MPAHRQEFFSSAVLACRTDRVTEERSRSASSHSSDDLGSFRGSLKSRAGDASTGGLDASLYSLLRLPWNSKQRVATSSADAMEFEFTVQETVFMAGEDEEGGAAGHPGAVLTSRQDALTRRCVSSWRKRRSHRGHLARVDGITTEDGSC